MFGKTLRARYFHSKEKVEFNITAIFYKFVDNFWIKYSEGHFLD